jgi:hypothetical protein
VVDAERCEHIEDGVDLGPAGAAMQPTWPPPLPPRGLTVVGCRTSVTSSGGTGAWHRVVHQRAAQQLAGTFGADRASEQRMADNPREEHT